MTTFNAKNLTKDRFGNYIYRLPSGYVRKYGKNKAEALRQIKSALKRY